MLLGGVLLSVWGETKRRVVTVMASTLLAGIGITLIAFVPSNGFLIALGLMLFVGLMLPILNGSVNAMMQACVPAGLQGRVFALLGALAMAASPIGLAIGGPLADSIGIQPLFLVAGVPTATMGIIGFLLPSLMRVEEPDSRPSKDMLAGFTTIREEAESGEF
jgi:DHA3 family macrolide efflux protein-like MFS transporter